MITKKFISLLTAVSVMISTVSANVIAGTVELYNLSSDSVVSSGAIEITGVKMFKFGSDETEFAPGEYDIAVSLMKSYDITSASMAGSCIKGGTLNVKEDGSAELTVALQPVSVFGLTDWAEDWKVYPAGGMSGSMEATKFTLNEDGKVDSITFDIVDAAADGRYVNMFINAMQARQDAYIAIDYASCKTEEDVKVYTGTYHVEQFGEYNVNVSVSVKGGVITAIDIEGSDFSGTYADFNKTKLKKAIDGLKEMITGKSSGDAKAIDEIDAVTGATISSNAIKSAVLNALSLAIEDEVINIPKEKLAQGQYTVDISYYTDNVKHSLVENEKIQAIINVDADGHLSLTNDIINGTVKEPLYVLDFNGYYADNDTTKEMLKDNNVSVSKEVSDYSDDVFSKGTSVVTKVTYPLVGDYAKVYNTNAKIYVPAMKNLQGEVANVYFDHGVFNTDCFTTVYWDSLKQVEQSIYRYGSSKTELKPSTYDVPVKLMNANNITSPSMANSCVKGAELIVNEDGSATVKVDLGTVTVGTISDWAEKWNIYQGNSTTSEVKPAIESINDQGKVESISFVLPDNSFDGVYLNMYVPVMNYSPDAYLAIDFENAKVKAEITTETTTDTTTEATTETTTEAATEVTTEVTTEAITEITTETITETSTETTTEPTTDTAKIVKYEVPVKMVQAANPTLDSMGNAALDGNAIVTVQNGKATVDLSFKAVTISGLYGHLLKLWSYPVSDAMNYDWWNDNAKEIPAEVVKTFMDYGMNYTNGDKTQSEFVKTVRLLRDAEKENSIFVRISVDAMTGFDQAARLDFDWDNAKIIEEVEISTDSSTEISTETSTETTTEYSIESTTNKQGGDSSSTGDQKIQDGKYWMEINLWNANIDQASMGNSAFENNRKALVTVTGKTAKFEIASNPVSVSGYTSALKDIRSSDVNISVDGRDSFTTNTRYDGQEHTFDYITKFSFGLDDITAEYIPVEISVPYTPMDGISANDGGYIAARIKLDWDGLQNASSSDTLNPDSSSATGSSSGGGGSSVSTKSDDTGIKIDAEELVFPDNTKFTTVIITNGTEFDTTKKLVGDNFRLFSISAENNGEAVIPNGVANVYFPVEKEDSENLVIYRIVEGDKNTEPGKTELEYKLSDDGKYYVVTVKEFGLFAITNSVEDTSKTVEEQIKSTDSEENPNSVFSDIEGHWAYDNILKAVELGLFNGMEENKFAPDMPASRAMFVTVLGRLNNVSENNDGDIEFNDVNKADYFYPYVVWAYENNIVSGISETEFSPNADITREQMARILYQFAKNSGIELKKIAKTEFADAEDISVWAEESVNALSEAGIINGRTDGTFDPKGNATRAEIATMLVNFVNEYMA